MRRRDLEAYVLNKYLLVKFFIKKYYSRLTLEIFPFLGRRSYDFEE